MNNRRLWSLMRETNAAIIPHYEPVLRRFFTETGLDARAWGILLAALSFEPETLSPARLQIRGPYTAAEAYLARLTPAAANGFLANVSGSEYRLTEAGRNATERSIRMVRSAMAEADPLPTSEAGHLLSLVRRLIGVSLATPPLPGTWSIRLSFKLMPATDPPLPYVEQAFSCLAAYRDDAHLAAWDSSGLSATALETLTFLWRGEADSLDAICAKLAHRGHPTQVYAQALGELREREFVAGADVAPRITKAGKSFRDEIEEKTDRYFFGPWASLSASEKAGLGDLLTRLRDRLRADAP